MKAVRVYEFGPVENLVVEDIPKPAPGPNEVLIKVRAAGIVFGDVLTRMGTDPKLPEVMPYTPGMEVAGVVEQVGSDVTTVAIGARVMAFVPEGGYAEYAVAPTALMTPLPDAVSFADSLVYLINMPVAHLVYHAFGAIQPGQTILLHAASGGVGTLLTQIAKRHDNTIIALAGSDEKADYCRSVGADHAINYKTSNYVEEVLRITKGEGVDVSLNSVAGPTLATDPEAIRTRGRWAIYGYAAGQGTIDPFAHFLKALTINISAAYAYMGQPAFAQAQGFMRQWLTTEPLLSPSRTFRLEDAQEAHRWIESQASHGKIVLQVGE